MRTPKNVLAALIVVATGVPHLAVAQQPQDPPRAAPAGPALETPFGTADLVLDKPIEAKEVRWTLWVAYPTLAGDYRDHATYLADLQARRGDKGVRVVVLLPTKMAATVAATTPGFTVGAYDGEVPSGTGYLVALSPASGPDATAASASLDGAIDRIDAVLADARDPAAGDADTLVDSLLNGIGDGGDFRESVEHCVQELPRSGRARAAAVLFQWWCKGDLVAARQAFDDGLAALGSEAVPLCVFADYVLRGDRTDPGIAKALAVALAPAAASARDGVFTQLVYLRALVRAGQDRLAGRIAATLQKQIATDGVALVWFAETLMEAVDPKPFRDLAEHALALAKDAPRNGVDRRLLLAARHKILCRCDAPVAEREALVREYREGGAFDSTLNNDAWYMVTRRSTMGRFDTLALAQAEEMLRQDGDRMDPGNQDTVALVLFLNGQVERAVELQTKAARARGNDPEYVGRLTRFENVLAQQRAAAKPK